RREYDETESSPASAQAQKASRYTQAEGTEPIFLPSARASLPGVSYASTIQAQCRNLRLSIRCCAEYLSPAWQIPQMNCAPAVPLPQRYDLNPGRSPYSWTSTAEGYLPNPPPHDAPPAGERWDDPH